MLIRRAEAPEGALFFLDRGPGSDEITVNFTVPGWKKSPVKDPAALSLSLGAEPLKLTGGYFWAPGRGMFQRPIDRSKLSLTVEGRSFLRQFASAKVVVISDGPREIARSSLPASQKAVEALRACERDALGRWGIDWAGSEALLSGPVPRKRLASLVSDTDYPAEASRTRAKGLSVARLEVDASGKVTECRTVGSSGHAILDRATCAVFLRRASFDPALDGAGRPVAAPYVTSIRWGIYP